jgi:hypothetical protein
MMRTSRPRSNTRWLGCRIELTQRAQSQTADLSSGIGLTRSSRGPRSHPDGLCGSAPLRETTFADLADLAQGFNTDEPSALRHFNAAKRRFNGAKRPLNPRRGYLPPRATFCRTFGPQRLARTILRGSHRGR